MCSGLWKNIISHIIMCADVADFVNIATTIKLRQPNFVDHDALAHWLGGL